MKDDMNDYYDPFSKYKKTRQSLSYQNVKQKVDEEIRKIKKEKESLKKDSDKDLIDKLDIKLSVLEDVRGWLMYE